MAAISQRGQGGRIIIIRVRASRCGESALNPPTSQPIPRRRPAPAPTQRRALPEHFHSPTQPRRTPAAAPCIPRRPHNPFPAEDLRSPPHTSAPPLSDDAHPPRDDAHPPTPLHIPRRRTSPVPAQRRALPELFRSPTQRRRTPADLTTHSPPKICSHPRTLPLPHAAQTPARRLRDAFLADLTTHSPPKAFARPRTATRPSRAFSPPHATPTHARRLRDAFPADLTTHSPPKICSRPRTTTLPSRALSLPTQRRRTPADLTTPSPPKTFARSLTATRPSRAFSHPHAAPTHARRLRDARPPTSQHISRRRSAPTPAHFRSPTQPRRTPAGCAMHSPPISQPIPRQKPSPFLYSDTPSPPKAVAPPSVPLRAQKNGTAQCMCDAECLGRPSLRSVIGVGEPRAVRRHCGALAWRVGLRPQPWALRSRRCGRVLRA